MELLEKINEEIGKAALALWIIKKIDPDVLIPEMEIEGKKVYGIGLKGNKAYVVFPEGMEDVIKEVFGVEEVVKLTPPKAEGVKASATH
ncbi:hypothetical protein IPA_02415 [Ignicoccus pacificus DSM 13166]|uniref:Uncharacterized protein n=1 Tax=Ignicoccus pacificus DSM 13166 TaxID=940294 RepID=A0A977PKM9_9CREN|nr:hypothetical protein IPA_02415 [Ignicoccus pacificus DSM 13166]